MSAQFSLDVTVDEQTGKVLAAYFHIRTGKSARTKVLQEGLLLADYNDSGKLVGIELLGPCKATVLDSIRLEKQAKSFVQRAAPRELVVA